MYAKKVSRRARAKMTLDEIITAAFLGGTFYAMDLIKGTIDLVHQDISDTPVVDVTAIDS